MNIPVSELLKRPVSFITDSSPQRDIFISTRIRLSRNLAGRSFPAAATPESSREVCDDVQKAVEETGALGEDCCVFESDRLGKLDLQVLLERRLASAEFIARPVGTRLLIRHDEGAAIMINEEDLLRIQVLKPGGQLDATWEEINRIDDLLASKLDFAFDDRLGYLTACPTNVGTGMRASVMLHLPGLMITDQIAGTIRGVNKLGLAVRGIFGEGSDNRGNLYQISNQSTLGESEAQIILNLKNVLYRLFDQEHRAREMLLARDRFALLDHVGRSYGVLKYSYKLSSDEVLNCLSGLRLGIDLGLFNSVKIHQVNELFIATASGHLQKQAGGELSSEECDIRRAALCRQSLQ